jgi:hypothetical protein
MKKRCNNPNHTFYHRYGGRGIRICDEWNNSFLSFREWALSHGYKDGLTIERIDNDGNYDPYNCKFIPMQEQHKNRCTNKYITLNGETKTHIEWARTIGISEAAFCLRVKNGFTGSELFAPSHQGSGKRDTDIIINGVRKTASKWAEQVGIHPSTFLYRVKKWGISERLLIKSLTQ